MSQVARIYLMWAVSRMGRKITMQQALELRSRTRPETGMGQRLSVGSLSSEELAALVKRHGATTPVRDVLRACPAPA